MRFTGKVWKQGGSMLLTVPKDCVYVLGLSNHQQVSVEIKARFDIMCACGKLYVEGQNADHECEYVKLPEGREVEAISSFLKIHKEKMRTQGKE